MAVVLGLCVALEHQASAKLNEENNAMRQQVRRMDKLLTENQRLSRLAAEAKTPRSQLKSADELLSSNDEQAKELIRLRAEVDALHRESKELETLRADTRRARASLEAAAATQRANRSANGYNSIPGSSGSGFEIVSANYWTDKTNLDVSDELRERIRGDTLKAVASNNLKGDPHFGETKRLTLVYRYGGALMTNEFREGDVIVLPKPENQAQ